MHETGGIMGSGWMLMCGVFVILLGSAIILLIIWLYKQIRGYHAVPRTESPLDILKKRFARGEIDKKEFEERKKDLE